MSGRGFLLNSKHGSHNCKGIVLLVLCVNTSYNLRLSTLFITPFVQRTAYELTLDFGQTDPGKTFLVDINKDGIIQNTTAFQECDPVASDRSLRYVLPNPGVTDRKYQLTV